LPVRKKQNTGCSAFLVYANKKVLIFFRVVGKYYTVVTAVCGNLF